MYCLFIVFKKGSAVIFYLLFQNFPFICVLSFLWGATFCLTNPDDLFPQLIRISEGLLCVHSRRHSVRLFSCYTLSHLWVIDSQARQDFRMSVKLSDALLLADFRNIARTWVTLTSNSLLRRRILRQQINCSWWTWTKQSLWAFHSSIQNLFNMCSCSLGKNIDIRLYDIMCLDCICRWMMPNLFLVSCSKFDILLPWDWFCNEERHGTWFPGNESWKLWEVL
jgi:hypothetical protein